MQSVILTLCSAPAAVILLSLPSGPPASAAGASRAVGQRWDGVDPQVALLGKAFVLLFSFLAEQNPVLLAFYCVAEALCTVSNSTNKVFLVGMVP